MTVKEILALEDAGGEILILHKEGLFWRAYQYSAYLFCTHFRPLKVTAKFVKTVQKEIYYIGFPEQSLEGILKEATQRDWEVERQQRQIQINLEVDVSIPSIEYTKFANFG